MTDQSLNRHSHNVMIGQMNRILVEQYEEGTCTNEFPFPCEVCRILRAPFLMSLAGPT